MDAGAVIDSLERFPGLLRSAAAGLDEAEARWRPDEAAWSILEIAGHLVDEEQVDFRGRLQSLLEDPERRWERWDIRQRVVELRHNEGNLGQFLDRLESLRRENVAWLRGLTGHPWDQVFRDGEFEIRAGDLLLSWAAHDLLHARQIVNRRLQLLQRTGAPYSDDYAT